MESSFFDSIGNWMGAPTFEGGTMTNGHLLGGGITGLGAFLEKDPRKREEMMKRMMSLGGFMGGMRQPALLGAPMLPPATPPTPPAGPMGPPSAPFLAPVNS